ncbi:hypothetical protein [Streptomyces mirabilis]|uniref:hypothetical protein n=1 Tax=Streptomyces mirabilis TaxID=68239 RepID=UPI0036DB0D66
MPLNDLLEKAARLQAMQGRDDKAATLDSEMTYAYALDIAKSERDENGDLIVYGKATGPDRDLDGDRCDPGWLKRAMPKWFEWGNMREMHQPVLAGVGLEMTQDGDDWYVKSKVIDPDCAKKVETGGYKGQSIGIKNGQRQVRDGQNWIVDGEIVEISYVDRPCNPTAKLAIAKVAGDSWQPGEAGQEDTKALATTSNAHGAHLQNEDGREQVDGDPDGADDHDGNDRDTGDQESPKPAAQTDPNSQTPRKKKKGKKLGHGSSKAATAERMAALAFITKALDQRKVKESAQGSSDVQGAMEAVKMIARLIQSEARDLAKGQLHETFDIDCLMQAVYALKAFMSAEEGAMDMRNLSAEADTTKAVEETPAGTKTPESDEKKSAEGTTETVAEIVKAAVAEVRQASEERIAALEAELTKVKAQPVPGGPVLLAGGATAPVKDDNLTKAAEYRRKAKSLSPELAADYEAAADELEKLSA